MKYDLDNLVIARQDVAAQARARQRWNAIAKPIGSLGLLEDAVVSIAGLVGSENVDISRRCLVVLCADNGVVAEGVSQCGQEVTATVAASIAQGISSVCRMCAPVHIDCVGVDIGMVSHPDQPGLLSHRVAAGTANIAEGPAMTRDQALQAIGVGIELVGELKSQGYQLIATGEMGIGNTTTATAMACVFTGMSPEQLVGRGAGLSDEGLARKRAVVARALSINQVQADDPLDVLAKLGGLDIAGLVGLFLGGAVHRVPVVIDGAISVVAAYCASLMQPECLAAMLPSHRSSEPIAGILLDRMGLRPPIDAGLHLGEGTGAACLVPLLDMALSLYRSGTTFEQCGMEPYEVRP